MWDRTWMRLRSLFVPSVAVVALFDVRGTTTPTDAITQLFAWERDRIFTLAKGLAAFAVAVLTTLIVDAVENKVDAPAAAIYLSALFVGLLLVWAAYIVTGLRRLSEQYALALYLFT